MDLIVTGAGVAVALWAGGVWFLVVHRRVPTLEEQMRAQEALSAGRPGLAEFGTARRAGRRPLSSQTAITWIGEWFARTASPRMLEALGLRTEQLARDLALRGKGDSVGYWLGGKVVLALWGFAVLPILRLLGVEIALPGLWGVGLGVAGFFLPDVLLRSELKQRRRELGDGVAELAVLMSVAVSGGASVEQAFRRAVQAARGPFAGYLRDAARPGIAAAELVDAVVARFGIPEAHPLVASLRAAEQGARISDSLEDLAWTLVEERRIQALQAGRQEVLTMVAVTAALMVPGYLLLLAFPGVRETLRMLGGG